MSVDFLRVLIAIAISLLLSYGLWSISEGMSVFILVGSVIFLSVTLMGAMAITLENGRSNINLSVFSYLFFVIGLIINFVFSFTEHSPVAYILTSGISFLLYVFIADFLTRTRQ
jgi:hypothetical protein